MGVSLKIMHAFLQMFKQTKDQQKHVDAFDFSSQAISLDN